MIGRLLGVVPITAWLMVAALAVAGWQWWQADRYQAQAAQAITELKQSEARADALAGALDWQREQIQQLSETLDRRDEQLATITADIRASRDALTTLERNDAATRDWSAEPVPDGIADWVRQLADDAVADHAGADGARASDRATTGSGQR
ncbi:hypothetical protein [Modicisalibacter muralis]|uniref:hypothetical protein n=1 Tax=Modicisalibacter muralis TaxID=119000 RepID=UPI001113A0BD|nr:hypothetical protein [Halomonas muralis]